MGLMYELIKRGERLSLMVGFFSYLDFSSSNFLSNFDVDSLKFLKFS